MPTAPSGAELAILRNVEAAARLHGIRVFVSVFPAGSRTTPLTPEAQQQLALYAAALVRSVPTFDDVIVGNEPNLNRFWLPQFADDGSDAAAVSYEATLAAAYDAVKAVDPPVRVWGGALAPRGIDRPNTGRDTHSPTAFIRDLGAAYRASGTNAPADGRLRVPPLCGHVEPVARLRAPELDHDRRRRLRQARRRCSARRSTARRRPARRSRSSTTSSAWRR